MSSSSSDSSSSDACSSGSSGRSLVNETILSNKIVVALEASMDGAKVASFRCPHGFGFIALKVSFRCPYGLGFATLRVESL